MRTSYILSVCTDWKENSLKIIAQCLNQGHQAELFNTSVICYKSFKFPVGDYEILSKVSLCSESHVSWPAESRLRRMRLERFHTINHCLLPLAVLATSPLCAPSSLQPPCFSRSYFWCWLNHQPSILFLDCGFSSPSKYLLAFFSFTPLCFVSIVI